MVRSGRTAPGRTASPTMTVRAPSVQRATITISSTATDLLKWDRALAVSRLVSPETQGEVFTSATLSDGRTTASGMG